jgi:hypothetical protein
MNIPSAADHPAPSASQPQAASISPTAVLKLQQTHAHDSDLGLAQASIIEVLVSAIIFFSDSPLNSAQHVIFFLNWRRFTPLTNLNAD